MIAHRNQILRQQHRLLHRIHRRYRTTTKLLQWEAVSLPFTRVANPDAVLDEIAAEEDRRQRITGERILEPQHLPYWAEVWDSALGMARHLSRQPEIVAGRSVLDLGCGQGLAGCAAITSGAADILFADLEAPALLFARYNGLAAALAARLNTRINTRQLNWQTDQLRQRFDLIVGADILYERQQWPFLEPFWRKHLAPGGSILLGEPGRPTGEAFIPWISARGWTPALHEQPVPTRQRPIRILHLRLNDPE